jgi:hypothetical protein
MSFGRLAVILAAALLLVVPVSAAPISLQLYDTGLNKLATAVGSISGDAGTYTVSVNTWFGNIVICQADLNWTLSNVTFQVTPQGVTFTGQLSLSYCNLSYSSNVTGSASASFQQSPPAVTISVSDIVVPVQFNLPIVGNVTITTLTINPQASYTVYMSPATLYQPTPAGTPETIYAQVTQATITYQTGYVQIDCEVSIW